MSSPKIKNISLHISGNQNYKLRHPGPHEGRSRSSRSGAGCVDAARGCDGRFSVRPCVSAPDETPKPVRRSRVVLAPRCWRQALWDVFRGKVTVTTSPLHRGEHEVSRKAIAQGMSECFRSPVCSCAPNAQFLAHETAGAACTRHSLRPLASEDGSTRNNSRESRGEIVRLCLLLTLGWICLRFAG